MLVAGSRRASFTGEKDRLLFIVVAKQTATTLRCRRCEEARVQLLRKRNEHLAHLELQRECMPTACVVFDAQVFIIDCNPAAERNFGYVRAEVTGQEGDMRLDPPPRREYA